MLNKIKIFYDGSSVAEYCNFANVVGVTTNISFLKKRKIILIVSIALQR